MATWDCGAQNCPTHRDAKHYCQAGSGVWFCRRLDPPCPGHAAPYDRHCPHHGSYSDRWRPDPLPPPISAGGWNVGTTNRQFLDIPRVPGLLFIVVDQLPDVGGDKLVRKIAVLPHNLGTAALQPKNPSGTLSLAAHALNLAPDKSQLISTSNMPFGAPTMEGKPILVDIAKCRQAGATIFSVEELVADLERYATRNPTEANRIQKLIQVVQNIEGEVLIEGGAPPGSLSRPSRPHRAYVEAAEKAWDLHKGTPDLDKQLKGLSSSYAKARVVGQVGRVFVVVGVVLTVKDVGYAAHRSVTERSGKPLAAEAIRQVGGWGAAWAGCKLGFVVGAALGIETGPGAIVTGAIGAIILGGAGYFGFDKLADQISPN